MFDISNIVKDVLSNIPQEWTDSLNERLPQIETGVGVAGFFVAIGLAIAETIESSKAVEERKRQLGKSELTREEELLVRAPHYGPCLGVSLGSAALIFLSDHEQSERLAAATTLYAIADKSRKEYQEYKKTAKEVLGEDLEKKVTQELNKKKVKEHEEQIKQVIEERGYEPPHAYPIVEDEFNNIYYTTIGDMQQRVARANKELFSNACSYISVEDLHRYYPENTYFGNRHNKKYRELGWNLTKNGMVDVTFTEGTLADGTPCYFMYYSNPPISKYSTFG